MAKTIMFVGHGRAGKDTACEYLAKITGLRNAGTTSKYLCEYVAAKLGFPVGVAYARRHESDEMRMVWYNAGNELREQGPTTLVRQALAHGEITGGVRALDEIVAVREEGLVDLIVWVDNNRVPVDPTVKFTEKECDLVIPNHWSIEEFHERIKRFACFAGLLRKHELACGLTQNAIKVFEMARIQRREQANVDNEALSSPTRKQVEHSRMLGNHVRERSEA